MSGRLMVNRFVDSLMGRLGHSRGATVRLWLLVALPLLFSSGNAHSDDGGASDRSRWEPSLSISLALMLNEQSGSGVSTVSDPISGSEMTLSPGFGLALGLTSPAVEILPMHPRFFVSGAFIPTIAFDLDIAKEGDPRGFVLPRQEYEDQGYPESAIDGQGSLVAGQVQVLSWSVDAGIEISRTIAERVVYLRPSFSWSRFEIDTQGTVLRAFKPNYNPEPGYPRLVTLEDWASRPYDAIGGGLEIGIDMGRRGVLRPYVYLSGQFYSILGDRTIGMSDSFTDSFGTESAIWQYDVDSFLCRIQVGFRVAWLGAAR